MLFRSLLGDRGLLVQDEFGAPKERAVAVRWAMLTRAEVQIDGPGRATLVRDGKKLAFRVVEPAGAELRVFVTDPPPAATDAPNPGTRMLGFFVQVPAGVRTRVRVELVGLQSRP